MKHYVVTTLIQSEKIDGGEPVEVQWYAGPSLGKAIAAAANATAEGGEPSPDAGYRVLAVATRIEEVQPEEAEVKPEVCAACGAVEGTDAYDNLHDSQNCWVDKNG